MPIIDRAAVRDRLQARLAQQGALTAGDVDAALKDLGRDGALDAADRAVLDDVAGAMDPGARARRDAFIGAPPAAGVPAPPALPKLSSSPLLAPVAAGTAALQQGARGEAVQALQQALVDLGFADWAPTETFGPKTKAALLDFQVAHNGRQAALPVARAPLATDGVLGRMTLAALDDWLQGALRAAPTGSAIGGGADQADVVVDLTKQVAWVNAALVDPAKLDGLLARLDAEPQPASRQAYARLRARLIDDAGALIDDAAAKGLASEHELGLQDTDDTTRVFVPFKVAVGARSGPGWLTPTGTFRIGDKRQNREGSQWGHPNGFSRDAANPFGPRWLRLYRETAAGPSHTAYGFHGTTASATWMNQADGRRAVSHGCIRFPNEDIVKLFEYPPAGARVRIVEATADRPGPAPVA